MSEKFDKQDQLVVVQESDNISRDLEDAKTEVQKAIDNPESIKDLSFSEIANLLNKNDLINKNGGLNFCDHLLMPIIEKIINERYPYSEGWKTLTDNFGHRDPWIRNRDGKEVGIERNETNGKYDWYGYEG